MSYFATVEVYKAGPGAESKIKETLREALPEETSGFMGLGVLGVASNEDGGITIDVGGSIKEEDLELCGNRLMCFVKNILVGSSF